MDQPTTGGRWVRDPESGALSKVEETDAPAPEAGSETDGKPTKANTAKRGQE